MLPNDINRFFLEALNDQMSGRSEEALSKYNEILDVRSNHSETLHHAGIIYLQQGNLNRAVCMIKKSLEFDSTNSNALSNLGYCLNALGKFDEAIGYCDEASRIDPTNDGAWTNLGNAQRGLSLWNAALDSYQRALNLQPHNFRYIYNLANVWYDQQIFKSASDLFIQCLVLQNNFPEAHNNLSACLLRLGQHATALTHANRAIELNPHYFEAWSNRGNALIDLNRHEEALASYERSIQLKPDYAEAWSNRGNALNDLNRHEEALASYERSIQLKPDYAEAWSNRGNALNDLNRHEEALASYEQSIQLKPDAKFVLGNLINTKMQLCDWANLEDQLASLKARVLDNELVCAPFIALGLFDDPQLQKRCSMIYAKTKIYPASPVEIISKRQRGEKIRIGYFSMDFRDHPVSHLIADLVKLHNRNKFKIYGFSFGIKTNDPIRKRLEKTFDKFFDTRTLSDLNTARLSREQGIDIAIDLGGYTQNSRPGIFACRAAPIQISYLGFPGTTGSSQLDYFIGDKIAVTDENRVHFTEKIIFLPNSFQANPSHLTINSKKLSRDAFGLPEGLFVFCCMNNTWKINPDNVASWARILRKVPASVLWLSVSNTVARSNLLKTFTKEGIDNDRLIFSNRVTRVAYLDQYRFADLFLDSLPYNAGATASDALRMGLPVLTLAGRSFAGRMAASLLSNIGLSELVTTYIEQYESLAIELATNRDKLAAIKQRLCINFSSTPLFDARLFTQHIESAFQTAYSRYQSGLLPDHIYVDP
jgi:predicted O-linked N-acetylglucosamine transferase (SPINDLY family)